MKDNEFGLNFQALDVKVTKSIFDSPEKTLLFALTIFILFFACCLGGIYLYQMQPQVTEPVIMILAILSLPMYVFLFVYLTHLSKKRVEAGYVRLAKFATDNNWQFYNDIELPENAKQALYARLMYWNIPLITNIIPFELRAKRLHGMTAIGNVEIYYLYVRRLFFSTNQCMTIAVDRGQDWHSAVLMYHPINESLGMQVLLRKYFVQQKRLMEGGYAA